MVANLEEGSVFGEVGILTGQVRMATIVCSSDCTFGIMTADIFKDIMFVNL